MDGRQALAVGCGLNARGILGIVMAAAAYDAQLIDLRLFVACVLMCVVTTMAAGPALSLILGRRPLSAARAGSLGEVPATALSSAHRPADFLEATPR